jgi:hypothetical protein
MISTANLTNLFNRLNRAQAGHIGFPFTGRARVAAKTGAEQVPRSYVGSVDAAHPRLLLAAIAIRIRIPSVAL